MYNIGLSGMRGLSASFQKHFAGYVRQYPGLPWPVGLLGHDAAAAVVGTGGEVLFAVEEERLNRIKHTMGLPELGVAAAREILGDEPDLAASYYLNLSDDHLAARVDGFKRLGAEAYLASMEREYGDARRRILQGLAGWERMAFVDHHYAHAASAFYPSGFDTALVLVIDGTGESAGTSVYLGEGSTLRCIASFPMTGSLGALYESVTQLLGFQGLEDEYKVMGLAAYGDGDEYRSFFDSLIRWQDQASFVIPAFMDWTNATQWAAPLGMRRPDEPITARHIAVAHSLQKAFERALLRILEHHAARLRMRHLCLAGGAALNCAANGVIDRTGLFDEIFVQPASNDAGTALGAALASHYRANRGDARTRMDDVYLGPQYSSFQIGEALELFSDKLAIERPPDLLEDIADQLAAGKVVGWFQEKMEFGPRALGNRSILADPRRADMKDRINAIVKKREEFRPFAPSVLDCNANEFFELKGPQRQYGFMTIAVKTAPKASEIPAVVHVDGTARVHVVERRVNPRYWELLSRFGKKTSIPVLLNTSFNVKGEPIVCTPRDAIECFLSTRIDVLAIGDWLVTKRI